MKERESCFELLRIIAMFFIVIWHISVHAQKGELITHDFIGSITITGVNIFILITGYFGLKLQWKSLLNIIAMVIFYHIITLVMNYVIFDQEPSIGNIICIFAPISRTPYWFVNCYLILMLLSPALNIVKEKATKRQYIYILGVLIYLSCITGFVFRQRINYNGYCVMQFITMYFIGDAIKRYNAIKLIKKKYLVSIYLFSTAILYIGGLFDIERTYAYNNPVLMLAAISLFCLIAKIKFSSSSINTFAQYMFPVYLLQESVFRRRIYKELYNFGIKQDFCSAEYFLILAFYICTLFVGAITLESGRKMIMNRAVENLSKFFNKTANLFPRT